MDKMTDSRAVEVLERMRIAWPLAKDEGPALDAAIARLREPAGVGGEWVLVPREPTREMVEAGVMFGTSPNRAAIIFQSMVHAAPQPPAEAQARGQAVDREADRARFSDAAFNDWLDTGISDAGHTVWDAVGDVQAAWAGWEARQFAGDAVLVAECCGREECGGECGNEWRGLGMYRKPEAAPQPPAEAQPDPSFAEWLATEMPAGTVIGDPAWWANRIARQYAKRRIPAEAHAQGGGEVG